jgi:carbamoyl-phosphate synthase large subunit
VSGPSAVALGADKMLTHDWLVRNAFPTVRQADPAAVAAAPSEWPFPLLVKPRRGSASIGVAVVEDPRALEVATRGGDFVVQSLARGDEHTVDVYVDRAGTVCEAVPRRRLEVRGGEVSKAVTVRLDDVEGLAREIGGCLPDAFGALNIQLFREEATGTLAVIEVNARFGGGYPLADAAGAVFPQWLVEEATGLPRSAPAAPWRPGVVMLRYDDAVFVDRADAGL